MISSNLYQLTQVDGLDISVGGSYQNNALKDCDMVIGIMKNLEIRATCAIIYPGYSTAFCANIPGTGTLGCSFLSWDKDNGTTTINPGSIDYKLAGFIAISHLK